ncbi:DUF1214 domain-containing protein [Litorivivens sp.]|uniref:DUF1214 domain-containing protein n=1 Tax=Litorivivens sp. TaxID=2020868 RepID=UPI0035641333
MARLFGGLVVLLLLAASYFYGLTHGSVTVEAPPAAWAESEPAAQAWQQHMVSLEAAAARVMAIAPDTREREAGLAYLAQLSSAALEMKVAKGDPAYPGFTDWMADYRKFLGDSPDAVYHTAEIDARYQYEVTGNRGDAAYLGFMLYGTAANGWNRPAGNLSTQSLTVDAKGNFRVLLSTERPTDYRGDWLQLDDDIHMLMVRQYYHRRDRARLARLAIRNLSAVGREPLPLAKRLHAATTFFNETLNGNIALMAMLQASPNSFEPPTSYNQSFGGVFYPTHDNTYFGTWFSLNDDEAMVVEGVAPEVDYWSISIQNRWMQSLDYQAAPHTSLNNRDIEIDEDGRYRVIVSREALANASWLDTNGYNHGLLSIRYQLAEGAQPPRLKIVKRDQL